jgi:excisionase family DNA binding protein
MLLGLKDAAKALGISHSTLYQMTGQGDIEWVSMGNRKYISRESLLEFIKGETRTVGTTRRASIAAARPATRMVPRWSDQGGGPSSPIARSGATPKRLTMATVT